MVHIPGTGSSNTNNSTHHSNTTSSTSNTSNMNTTSNTSGSHNPLSETKAKISSFLGRDGQADTTVHETINPAVEHEHISRVEREERQKIIDREIHQEHHHTTVQPVVDHKVAPTTHTNRVESVETREIQHGNDAKVRAELERERAQFRNTQDVAPTVVQETTGPTVAGEHVHHHVHENIQPVIERDIHQEHVIHTTKPVHEIHQNESIHHSATVLPPVDVSQFKQQGGALEGRQERVDAFQGPPKPIESTHHIGGPGAQGSTTVTDNEGRGSSTINQSSMGHTHMSGSNHGTAGTGMTGNRMSTNSNSSSSSSDFDQKAGISRNGGMTDSSRSGLGNTNAHSGGAGLGSGSAGTGSSTTAQGMTGTSGVGGASTGMAGGATHGTTGMINAQGERGALGNNVQGQGSGYNASSGNTQNTTGQTAKKGSLIDKLNPTKDSTGHGEPGFMR